MFCFERTKYSLNEVSHDTAIGLINLLLSNNINVHEVNKFIWSHIIIYLTYFCDMIISWVSEGQKRTCQLPMLHNLNGTHHQSLVRLPWMWWSPKLTCSASAEPSGPLATFFCRWVIRKYWFWDQTFMLGALNCKGLEVIGSQLLFLEHNLGHFHSESCYNTCQKMPSQSFSVTPQKVKPHQIIIILLHCYTFSTLQCCLVHSSIFAGKSKYL